MSDYPTDLDEQITLPNRKRVRIRPLRHCEVAVVRDLYARLTPRTRYLRFLSPMPALPDSTLQTLACVDDRRRLSFVAEEDGACGEVVALGNFGAIDDDSVEVALVVRDDWQGQRLGTILAKRLLRAAETRGFHRFVAHVLIENAPIRRILEHVGRVVSAKFDGGVLELAFVLRGPSTYATASNVHD